MNRISGAFAGGYGEGKAIGVKAPEKTMELGAQGAVKGKVLALEMREKATTLMEKRLVDITELYDSVLTEEQKAKIQDKKQQFYDKIEQGKANLMEMSDVMTDKLLNVVRDAIVEGAINDADMPRTVQWGITRGVESVWPDVAEEVKYELHNAIRKEKPDIDNKPKTCYCWPKAFFLRHNQPHNRSIFYSLKSIPWWMFALIANTPVFIVRVQTHK